MKVKCIKNRFVDCPPEISYIGSPQTETHLTINKDYEVYGILLYKHMFSTPVTSVLVKNDAELVRWEPLWFFEITDGKIPHDWMANKFNETTGVNLVIADDFITKDYEAYRQITEWETGEATIKFIEKHESHSTLT